VWQAIALHTSAGLANRFGPEQSVSHFGIALDISGIEKNLLSAFRRAGARGVATPGSGLRNRRTHCRRHPIQPDEGSPFSFPAHIHEVINGASMTFLDMVKNSGWGDGPLKNSAT